MFRKIAWIVVAAVVLTGAMAAQAHAQFEKYDVSREQLGEVGAGLGTQQLGLDQESQSLPSTALAAAGGGVKYFGTYGQASSFARSVSGGYYTSITKSGKWYRVDYWRKGDHG